jgi:hypothetical protein
MSRYEELKAHMGSPEELASYLCRKTDECEFCPGQNLCHVGSRGNGLAEWLKGDDPDEGH